MYSGRGPTYVVKYAAEGIYTTGGDSEGGTYGLSLFPLPGRGEPRLISGAIALPFVANGFAWGVAFNPADPSPGPGGLRGPVNEILRFDLNTGQSTLRLYWPGWSLYIIGADQSGNLFVAGQTSDMNSGVVLKVASNASATVVFKDNSASPPWSLPYFVAAADTNGVWFDSYNPTLDSSGIWLATGGQIQLAATINRGEVRIDSGCF